MKKQKIALVLGLLIAGCSSDQSEQSVSVAQGLATPMVYANGQLATGWSPYNNMVTYAMNSTAILYNGEHTYSATFRPWEWISFYSTTYVSGYDAIEFYANARTNTKPPNLHMEVLLGADPYNWGDWVVDGTSVATFCDGGKMPANTWVRCRIPLSIFGIGSSAQVYGFSLDEQAGKTWKPMAFARFQFINTTQQGAGGATSTGGSTSVAGGSSVIGGSTSSGGSTTTTTSTVAGGETSLGGSSANGGVGSIGGSNALGGDTSSGGSTTVSGGTSSIGGSSTSVGGTTSEGGSVSLGGTSSAGGSSEIGGTSSIGGTTSIGGSSAEGGTVSAGGTSSIGGSSSAGGGAALSLHRTPFYELPEHNGSLSNPWTNGEPYLIKDRTPGKAGEIFGFGWSNAFYMYKTGDYGVTWSYVDPTPGDTLGSDSFMTAVQDSTGAVHMLFKNGGTGSVEYSRVALDYTGATITGFHSVVDRVAIPGTYNTNVDVRGVLRVVYDQSGQESLVYHVSDNPAEGLRIQMGVATSLVPTSTYSFVKLDGTPGATLVYEMFGTTNHDHATNFAQLGSSRDLWAFEGPINAEYGWSGGDNFMRRIRLTASGPHTWDFDVPITFSTNVMPFPSSEILSVYGTENYVWLLYIDAIDGVCIDRVSADGTWTHNAVPSPEPRRTAQNGMGTFTVSDDETRIYLILSTMQAGPGTDDRLGQMYWDGSSWTRFEDPAVGDRWGLGSITGWSEGVATASINDPRPGIKVSVIGRY